MTEARLGVAGQSATIRRDDDGRVVGIAFTRPVGFKVGDCLSFSLAPDWAFEVSSVEGRVVAVAPQSADSLPDAIESGTVGVVEAAAAAAAVDEQDAGSYEEEQMEERSTDGSDTEGSLKDFIESDPDSDAEDPYSVDAEEDEEPVDAKTEAAELAADFPFDKSLLEEDADAAEGAPRRSRRARAPVKRYLDSAYAERMLEGADPADVLQSDSEEEEDEADVDADSESEDFVVADSEEESEEEEEDSEEESYAD